MKKVEAIIRKSKFEEVKNALHEVDIDFFTYWDVTGVGKEKEGHIFRGAVYEANRIQRRMLSIVVRDQNLKRTIDAVIKSAWTGVIGDGKTGRCAATPAPGHERGTGTAGARGAAVR